MFLQVTKTLRLSFIGLLSEQNGLISFECKNQTSRPHSFIFYHIFVFKLSRQIKIVCP